MVKSANHKTSLSASLTLVNLYTCISSPSFSYEAIDFYMSFKLFNPSKPGSYYMYQQVYNNKIDSTYCPEFIHIIMVVRIIIDCFPTWH
jgi:hypothetical protein